MSHPRRFSGPSMEHAPALHLLEPLWRRASQEPSRPMLARREGDRFVEITAGELCGLVRTLAGGLIELGVQPKDRVALWSRTRLEWIELDYAILAAGAVTVPLYDTASEEQIDRILRDSGAVSVLVETAEQRTLIEQLSKAIPGVRQALAIEQGAMEQLRRMGERHLEEVERRVASLTGSSTAAIIYSSGTTGSPKGCELTHSNLTSNARQTAQQVPELFPPQARTLVFLPLAHAFARMQVHTSIEQGALIACASNLKELSTELQRFAPTFLVAVPRVFEKILNGARARSAAQGRERIFARSVGVAIRFSQVHRHGSSPSLGLRLLHRLFDRLVYRRLREALGGRVQYAICGGSALASNIGWFFDGVGIPILEGYGLTEASPVVSGGPAEPLRIGTVGRLYPGTTVEIAPDGEILVRGPQVFRGYWNNPAATEAALQDGWLHTGDLGEFTETGELRLTGRKKEILVTSSGKNVNPAQLEDLVRANPLVAQCVVVAENRPFVAALISLDRDEVDRFTQKRTGGAGQDLEQLIAMEVDSAVAAANRSVSRAEAIRNYRILDSDLSIASGELTPTLKLRRSVIAHRHQDEIEALYRGA